MYFYPEPPPLCVHTTTLEALSRKRTLTIAEPPPQHFCFSPLSSLRRLLYSVFPSPPSHLLLLAGGTMTTLTELDRPRPPRDLEPRREDEDEFDDEVLFPDGPLTPSLRFHDDTAVRQMAASGADCPELASPEVSGLGNAPAAMGVSFSVLARGRGAGMLSAAFCVVVVVVFAASL